MIFIWRVPAPVGSHNIELPITVEISGGHPVPPPDKFSQTEVFRHLDEFSAVVMKNPNRPPFAGEDQIGTAIAIEIAKHGAAHHPNSCQTPAVLGVDLKVPTGLPEEKRR